MSKEDECKTAYAKYKLQANYIKEYIRKQLRKEELEKKAKVCIKSPEWFHKLSKKNQQIVDKAVNVELEEDDK